MFALDVRPPKRLTAIGLTLLILAASCSSQQQAQTNPESIGTARQAETPDTFGVGSGRDGAFTAPAAGTVVNSYAPITAMNVAGTQVTAGTVRGNVAGFVADDLVLIWRTNGLAGQVSGVQTVVNLNGDVGAYELGRVKSVVGSVITLTNPLSSVARFSTFSQIVRVPEYTTVSVPGATSIVAAAWDGSSGGIVAFFATGTVTNAGKIAADAAGFRAGGIENINIANGRGSSALDGPTLEGGGATSGGAHKGEGFEADAWAVANDTAGNQGKGPVKTYGRGNYANGAGGGEAWNAGGGGGGNGGQGGIGGQTWIGDGPRPVGGLGGAAVTFSTAGHLALGGGGGAGEENNSAATSGGNGGGVVLLRVDTIAGAGTISAVGGSNPTVGANDGQGGGGAGGTIVLDARNAANCAGANAQGGAGASGGSDPDGPGGGGGGGVVVLTAASGACPANVSGGGSGTSTGSGTAYGAAAGSAGIVVTTGAGFTGSVCTAAVLGVNQCGGCVVNADCPAAQHICVSASNTCVACQTSTDCSGTTPVCNANACVACNGDNGTASTNACPTSGSPYCAAGGSCSTCASDTDCTTGTHAGPFCNVATGACGTACFSDAECGAGNWCDNLGGPGVCQAKVANGGSVPGGTCTVGVATRACVSTVCDPKDNKCGIATGDAPCTAVTGPSECRSAICATSGPNNGDCVQCVASSTCLTAATPVCDATSNACVACNGDNGTSATDACATSGAPYCTAGGSCATCASDTDCTTGTHAGPFCNVATGACGNACFTDAECGAGNWCNDLSGPGACQAKVANGTGVPGGTCTSPIGTRACVSTVCDPKDNKCGIANGDPTCNSTTGPTECRSAICATSGPNINDCVQCVASSTCSTATAPICDATTNTCVACNGDNGTSATDACATSGAPYCNLGTGACGTCTSDAQCGTGHAGAFCNVATGACGSACFADAECGAGNWCDNLSGPGICQPRVSNGQPVPGGSCTTPIATRACVSTVCDPKDNKCGIANGDPTCNSTTGPTECRSAICATSGPNINDCVQCVASSTCSTATAPICDATSNTCVACNGDNGTSATDACATSGAPYCNLGTGACGTCTSDAQCGTGHAGAFCNVATGACGSACFTDAECGSGSWCSNLSGPGVCAPLVPNGQPVPGGTCTAPLGARACVSAVCDTKDNKCGIASGDGTCTGANGPTECRSTICATTGPNTGNCVQCTLDSQCTAPTSSCDTATNTCVLPDAGAPTDAGTGADSGKGDSGAGGTDGGGGTDAGTHDSGAGDSGGGGVDSGAHDSGTGTDSGTGSDSGTGTDSGTGSDSGGTTADSGGPGSDAGGPGEDGGVIVSGDSGFPEADGGAAAGSGGVEGGGCSCRTAEGSRDSSPAGTFVAALAVGLLVQRRRRRPSAEG